MKKWGMLNQGMEVKKMMRYHEAEAGMQSLPNKGCVIAMPGGASAVLICV